MPITLKPKTRYAIPNGYTLRVVKGVARLVAIEEERCSYCDKYAMGYATPHSAVVRPVCAGQPKTGKHSSGETLFVAVYPRTPACEMFKLKKISNEK